MWTCETPHLCPQCQLQVHFILWHISLNYVSSAIEWHQRDGEVFQHNLPVSCQHASHKCWMSVSIIFMHLFYVYVLSIVSYIKLHNSITIVLKPGSEVYKKKDKLRHISHIVRMLYQHVAGSLTWITTAVSTAPFPSLSFCSSKCQFCFLSPCLLSSARRENIASIFVQGFEKMQSRMTISQICQRDITKPIG